jgi:hypothetical protein
VSAVGVWRICHACADKLGGLGSMLDSVLGKQLACRRLCAGLCSSMGCAGVQDSLLAQQSSVHARQYLLGPGNCFLQQQCTPISLVRVSVCRYVEEYHTSDIQRELGVDRGRLVSNFHKLLAAVGLLWLAPCDVHCLLAGLPASYQRSIMT